jgi:hypothetical protein
VGRWVFVFKLLTQLFRLAALVDSVSIRGKETATARHLASVTGPPETILVAGILLLSGVSAELPPDGV